MAQIKQYRMPSKRHLEVLMRRLDDSPNNLLVIPDYAKSKINVDIAYELQIVTYSQLLRKPEWFKGRHAIIPDYGTPDGLLDVIYILGQMQNKISYYTTRPVEIKEEEQ